MRVHDGYLLHKRVRAKDDVRSTPRGDAIAGQGDEPQLFFSLEVRNNDCLLMRKKECRFADVGAVRRAGRIGNNKNKKSGSSKDGVRNEKQK
jgi:hypothetical protein